MKKQYIAAVLMTGIGIIVFAVSGRFSFSSGSAQTAAAEEIETAAEAETQSSRPETPPKTEAAADEPFTPSPDELNLAHYFPEDADQSDPAKSYAGDIFRTLTTMDESWISNIYNYADISPEQMAARIGRPRSRVLGGYNPRDGRHDPGNPDTWTINSFRDIRMNVTDGDGNPISVYSNVHEIMAMANLYTYFKGVEDHQLFLSYAKGLWTASHSYSVSMSDIYYCSGCLDEDAERRRLEEMDAAEIAAEQTVNGSGEGDAGDTSAPENGNLAESTAPVIESNRGRKSLNQETAPSEETESLPPETSTVILSGSSRTAADVQQPEESAREISVTEGSVQEGSDSETPVSHETIPEETAAGAAHSGDTPAGNTFAEAAPAESLLAETAPAETAPAETKRVRSMVIPRTTEASSGEDQNASEAVEDQEASPSDASGYGASDANGSGSGTGTGGSASSGNTSSDKSGCPGHVDLIVNMKIRGLKEKNGLFSVDTLGNNPENIESGTENGWPGWDSYTINSAQLLSQQDWFEKYGLTVSVIKMINPLSASEIDSYMAQLPAELSEQRRSIIRFALSSVGKVPYYWGGKASAPNYAGNQFGSLMGPDTKGRVLRGLDCSGWINWVYWSVTGSRLPYESTSGLALCGARVNRDDLQPGDIIIRTGEDAHVIMFLGWTDDGRILCVHESSAGVNNVTVAVRDANWPYYRKLID